MGFVLICMYFTSFFEKTAAQKNSELPGCTHQPDRFHDFAPPHDEVVFSLKC